MRKVTTMPGMKVPVMQFMVWAMMLLFLGNVQAQYTLTILHNNDAESQLINAGTGVEDFGGVARFKSLADSLKAEAMMNGSGVVMLSSGDNFLAGPEFNASLNRAAGLPYYDAVAMDYIGYDAICIGNHDFDFGPDVLAKYIHDYTVTQPPYLSANLNFSLEDTLRNLLEIGRIKARTVVTTNGQNIGVIGLTTPMLSYISSPRNVQVSSDIENIVQAHVDTLTSQGVDKIILISHLQNVAEDTNLVRNLHGIDIVIAGGGDELLANPGNLLIPGDTPDGAYPLKVADLFGDTTYVVTTSGEYKYIGRLIVEFDAKGNVTSGTVTNIDLNSGPKRVAGGANPDSVPSNFLVQTQVVDSVADYVAALAGNIIGTTDVALDGIKNNVRTIETNEGNLVADALLWQAGQLAGTFSVNMPDVALQNGGGIRNNSTYPAGTDITELMTFDILPFANFVSIIENIPPSQFKEILENAVSRVEFVDGRFAQVAGFKFRWTTAGVAQQLDANGNVTVPGTRVIDVELTGGIKIVENGILVPGAPDINIATIDFLARGGDQYPYRNAPFTTLGVTYQQALNNYIITPLGGTVTAAMYPEGGEGRVTRNQPPYVANPVPDQSVFSGVSWNYTIPANTFMDPEGDPITLTDALLSDGNDLPGWLSFDPATGTFSGVPAHPMVLDVEVFATDGYETVSDIFTLTILKQNPLLEYMTSVSLGSFDEGAAEIVDYDPLSKRLFVTNAEFSTIDVLDFSDPMNPSLIQQIDITPYGGGINSLAVKNGYVAAAIENNDPQQDGSIVFFETSGSCNFVVALTAGAMPDMVTFTPDGAKVLTANEGEPNDDYTVDPLGSITIVDISGGIPGLTQANVTTLDFTGITSGMLDPSVRIYGNNGTATIAQDIEPEYIAVSGDSQTACVTLQENNAVAIIDLNTNTISAVKGLGFKDHLLNNNHLDASDKAAGIEFRNWPVYGMFLPDAIKSFSDGTNTYFVTANEGDSRDYNGYSEEVRVKDLTLDPVSFPNASYLKQNVNLGRLKTTLANGDIDNDGQWEEIYAYGTRSFSIWDASGNLVSDIGDDFEKIIAAAYPSYFNSDNDDNDSFKSRSDDKGPEPEAIEIAEINGRFFVFVGLERMSGIMVYDITNPTHPEFVEYVNNRNFTVDADSPEAGDLAPEDVVFIPQSESPVSYPLVVTSNEVSGTIGVYKVNTMNTVQPATITIMHNNDGESQLINAGQGLENYGGVHNFKGKVDSLRVAAANRLSPTIMLSSGDNFLAGPEFTASLNLPPNQPYYDAVAMDMIGYDAVCIGNHDFDFGPDILSKFVHDYSMTQPPYLSANLGFAAEDTLQNLVDIGRIAARTIVSTQGKQIGVIGLTTPQLPYISSPRNVAVDPNIVDIVQDHIDTLTAQGINKIILISHLQSILEDSTLVTQLTGLDVVIAGGGDELLTNDPSIALPGMTVYGEYPMKVNDLNNDTVYLVTTPGEYVYVGHLVVDFDENGVVTGIDNISNPVLVTNTIGDSAVYYAVTQPVMNYVAGLAANVIGTTDVDLDGIKNNVRTFETNEGNLVADALLWQAGQLAGTYGVNMPDVAMQNGGGIRNNSVIAAGSDISELTTFDILPFANFLCVAENITPAEFKEILENAVSRVEYVDGRFGQIAGFRVVWDPAGTAQVIDINGNIITPGTRIVDVELDNGTKIVENGVVNPAAPDLNIATIDFLARGGDQYIHLNNSFTTLGVTYQQTLYNYIVNGLSGAISYTQYPFGGEGRITKVTDATVWTGAVDTDWFDAANWNNGIPDASLNALIPDVTPNGFPVITGGLAEAGKVSINAGAYLTIAPLGNLSAYGNVMNDGLFSILTDNTGAAGSFIDNGNLTGYGTFMFNRDITGTGAFGAMEGWHYISSPVSGLYSHQIIPDYFLNTWDEPTNYWIHHEEVGGIPAMIPLNTMTGWSVKQDLAYTGQNPTGDVIEFAGLMTSVHTGALSVNFTASGFEPGDPNGLNNWNLLGNPYASPIDLATVTLPAGLYDGVYQYDDLALDYVEWVGGVGVQYVPATQGFMVKAISNGSLTFDNTVRSHAGQDAFHKNDVGNLLVMEATGNNYSDKLYIRFLDEATEGFDGDWDAFKLLTSAPMVPQIYTTGGGKDMAISSRPAVGSVPVHFTAGLQGAYTISVADAGDFSTLLLEDKLTGIMHDLKSGGYSFSYDPEEDDARFVLHLNPFGDSRNDLGIAIYGTNGNVYVGMPAGLSGKASVYSVMGLEIASRMVEGGLNIIALGNTAGNYIVRV
ncbi:MAG: choice-of-anchor I family protein, partial [Bacteroidales bacterium]|nr:choice-of-anchor I family protein [Bacteroidales bacterium]